ncbi:MAG: hypothetical protein DRN14_02140 [Thermoplasmata archaeon]|nr:MAG: hypothetical protein DRN14_02140 [Thermoplasmata archaeon]HDJ27528.1 hypothetical protein [Aciduliprofundum sp.]
MRWVFAILLLTILVLPSFSPSQGPRIGPRLLFLMDHGLEGEVEANVILAPGKGPDLLEGLEITGSVGRVFSVKGDLDTLLSLASTDGVLWVDAARPILQAQPLDVSIPQVGAPALWSRGFNGSGILIADLDSGADYRHPFLWHYNGTSYELVDSDGDGVPDPGEYADLNENGRGDAGEELGLLEDVVGHVMTPMVGAFDPGYDFLFVDSNGNGVRDGDEMLLLWDGSRLISQGWGVVDSIAVKQGGLIRVYHRWELDRAPGDYMGHGTAVTGILAGGGPGLRFRGAAPGADVMQIVVHGPASMSIVEGISVALSQGADVILIEVGSWVYEYLDGSSPEEQAVDEAVREGVPVVVPAGNLAKEKHAFMDVSGDGTFRFTLEGEATNVYLTVLWRDGPVPSFYLGARGDEVLLPCDGSIIAFKGHRVYSRLAPESPRGTRMLMVAISRDRGVMQWDWSLRVSGGDGGFHAYLADDNSTWEANAKFTRDFENHTSTVTSPSTADLAFCVGSYSTRGYYVEGPGALSPWSGRGPRIDGAQKPDITAPGNYDIITSAKDDIFEFFGGTSAAGPHVAGAVALLKHAYPNATVQEIYQALREGAERDRWTGETPNKDWGYGKLNVSKAFDLMDTFAPEVLDFDYTIAGNEVNFTLLVRDHHQVSGHLEVGGVVIPLFDDGLHGDAGAGDGVMAGSCPIEALPPGESEAVANLTDSVGNRYVGVVGEVSIPQVPELSLTALLVPLLLAEALGKKQRRRRDEEVVVDDAGVDGLDHNG